jgi:hypothetical protein
MHSTDILAWTVDGSVFCPDCKPAPTSRAAAVGHDDVSPWFADDEASLVGRTCDACGACYVDAAGWLPHADAVGPLVTWYRCATCATAHPSADAGKAPPCRFCGGRCTADAQRARIVAEAERAYAWPGGYPLHLVLADGGELCPACAGKEWRLLLAADPAREWTPVGAEVHWEGEPLHCCHCYSELPSAYGPVDPPDPDYDGPMVPTGGA